MNVRSLVGVAVVAIGLLAVSASFTFATRDDVDAFPSIEGRTPSGYLGLAEVLRANGYRVEMDRSTKPQFRADDVPLVVELTEPGEKGSLFYTGDRWDKDGTQKSVHDAVMKHLEAGGAMVHIDLKKDFQDASSEATTASVTNTLTGNTMQITESKLEPGTFFEYNKKVTPLLTTGDRLNNVAYLGLRTEKKGTVYFVENGLPFTNRFITQQENAKVALAVFRSAVPKTKRIVAVEAAFGNVHDKNLAEWAGRWAQVARDQFFFLVAVVAATLAMRFGTPVSERIKELGVRSMVDAMGANLSRLRRPSYSLHILLADVYERTRVALRAPVGTSRSELLKQMPVELAQQVQLCESMTTDEKPALFQRRAYVQNMLAQADRLDQLTTAFEKDSRTRRLG